MGKVVGDFVGADILEALGIDPENVYGIDISVRQGEIVTKVVRCAMTEVEVSKFCGLLKDYNSVPIEETEYYKLVKD